MYIRNTKKDDIRALVSLHLECFENFYLSELGDLFLNEFYKIALECDNVISYIYSDGIDDLGFVLGFEDAQVFRRALKRNFYLFLFPMVVAIIKRPRLLFRSFQRTIDVSRVEKSTVKGAELLSLAAKKNSIGIGTELLKQFCFHCTVKRIRTITLTTDHDNNKRVRDFYIKNGFIEIEYYIQHSRKMVKFRYDT